MMRFTLFFLIPFVSFAYDSSYTTLVHSMCSFDTNDTQGSLSSVGHFVPQYKRTFDTKSAIFKVKQSFGSHVARFAVCPTQKIFEVKGNIFAVTVWEDGTPWYGTACVQPEETTSSLTLGLVPRRSHLERFCGAPVKRDLNDQRLCPKHCGTCSICCGRRMSEYARSAWVANQR